MCFYGYWKYSDDPSLRHEMTLEELKEKIGQPAVFAGTTVDEETQNQLLDFFLLDRLVAPQKQFLWYWRRRLNLYYPIYKEELEMWAERKTEKWFFDNHKKETKTHDGTFKLDEETKAELQRTIARTVADVFAGTTSGTGKSSGTTERSSDSTGESSDTYANGSEGKDRNFSFNYPESNYQGGVIPYDLNNNPVVEFISTQGDHLDKSSDTHNGSGSDERHDTGDEIRSDQYENSGTNDHTNNTTADETDGETSTGTRGQETTTHWEESTDRQGDNLNALVDELITQIPSTNFFKKLTDKLKPCFQHTYLLDEIMEEDGIDDEYL